MGERLSPYEVMNEQTVTAVRAVALAFSKKGRIQLLITHPTNQNMPQHSQVLASYFLPTYVFFYYLLIFSSLIHMAHFYSQQKKSCIVNQTDIFVPLWSHQGLCGPPSVRGHSAGILVHSMALTGLSLQTWPMKTHTVNAAGLLCNKQTLDGNRHKAEVMLPFPGMTIPWPQFDLL